jgi:hypothetical protein
LREDGTIQITDFCINGLRQLQSNPTAKVDVGGFSSESWTPKVDVQAFARLLSEIAIGTSGGHGGYDPCVPSFVLEMIERGQSSDLKSVESFWDILKTLTQNDFKIMENIDIAQVRNFVSWIEWSEMLTEQTTSPHQWDRFPLVSSRLFFSLLLIRLYQTFKMRLNVILRGE